MAEPALLTGIGLCSTFGTSPAETWDALQAGAPRATTFADEFPAERFTDPRSVRKCSEAVRLFAAAAHLALDAAAFPSDPALREATWVLLGSAFGSSRYYLEFQEAVRRKGPRAANAVLFTESVWNAPAGHVSRIHGLMGAGWALAGGEEVGLSALVTAVDRLRLGEAEAVVAGGVEQQSAAVQASLLAEGLIGPGPGSLSGPTPGPFAEGAAALVLERAAGARARGAPALAAVAGVGRRRPTRAATVSGPRGPLDPAAAALLSAARDALDEAGVAAGELDLVVSQASGGWQTTRELAALGALIPADARVAWWAPKALLGEGFAWTSAALPALAALALQRGAVPGAPPLPPALPPGLVTGGGPLPRARHALVLAASQPGAAVAALIAAP